MNIVILDDHSEICSNLEEHIKSDFDAEVLCFNNVAPFLNFISKYGNKIDGIIMDISLSNNDNGIEVAKKVHNIQSEIEIIFITGYGHFYDDIYKYFQPLGFIQKPIQYNTLHFFLTKLYKITQYKKATIKIIVNRIETEVFINGVQYIESQGRKLRLVTEKEVYETYMTFKEILDILPDNFIQCHRSYIINLNFIKCIEKSCIRLKDNSIVDIGRNFKENLIITYEQFKDRKFL